ncbi:MAG: hypothetical protein H6742_21935 [Alphaproteobacteria bacterium]|nr:hypothetical protein [Alphaproteobacteria bacterium]
MRAPLALLLSLSPLVACTDKGGDPGTDSGDTAVADDLDVRFLSPLAGAWYAETTTVRAEIAVEDPDGGSVGGLELTWFGAAADAAGAPTATESDGGAVVDLSGLAPGVYDLGVQVRRADDGAVGFASVAFEVVDPDVDNDGYDAVAYGGDDCDDGDPTTNVAADEICDGDDNDCDGLVDEEDAIDIPTWYLDLDEDGYGTADEVTVDCQQPKDTVLVPGDCDDDNAAINPGAAEVCDEIDNDCDGLTDDEDPGLETASASAWYPDADKDTWGDYSTFALACEPPEGWVPDGGDCDDGDPTVNPDAPEYCDGLDNNCRDGVDEIGAVDAPLWYLDADIDDWGIEDDTIAACDQPTGYAAAPGDCDDDDGAVNPDAVEVCNDGIDNDCDGVWNGCEGVLEDDATAVLLGSAALDEAGYDAVPAGDVDGDGIDDLLVGARSTDHGALDAGSAYIVRGTLAGELDLSDAWLRLDGDGEEDRAGRRVAAGVDVTGDDVADMLVGAPNLDGSSTSLGAVYVIDGATPSAGTGALEDQHARFTGGARFDYLGVGVFLADLSGDGQGDVLLGASGVDVGGSASGALYLYEGPIAAGSTSVGSSTWDARLVGDPSTQLGLSADARGDLDGDGRVDLVVGVSRDATTASTAGAVAVFLGGISGELTLDDADLTILGESSADQLGALATSVPDRDDDGYDELLIGAPGVDDAGLDAGAAWIVDGRDDPSALDGWLISAAASVTFIGADSTDQLGMDGDGWGDHDGDGSWDLLLGAPGAGAESGGAALLFLGPLSGSYSGADADALWLGDTNSEGVGRLVRYGGGVTGGTGDAVLVGARSADLAGTDAGALFVVGESGL